MPLVISNSSTLIHLAAIGRLTLLKEFYGKVVIPTAVWREVVEKGKGRTGAVEVEKAHQAGWVEIASCEDEPVLRLLKRDLDEGEAEAIALAINRKANLILLDETEARSVAELYGLPKTGVIGILMRAREAGKVQSLRMELEKLRNQGGFWIDEEFYQQVLSVVGE